MLRSATSKVMWVGRATVFLVGLAVILALMFGAASTALGANGKPFLLGKRNVATAVSTLIKRGPGPALNLVVGPGQPPMTVNSAAKVANLNADTVDGLTAEELRGQRGQQGPRGPSDVYSASADAPPSPSGDVEVSVPVPAGNYLVSAKAVVWGDPLIGIVNCELRELTTENAFLSKLDASSAYAPDPSDDDARIQTVPSQAVVSLGEPRVLAYHCSGFGPDGARAENMKIAALQVGTVH